MSKHLNGLISKRRWILINILIRKEKYFLTLIAISTLAAGIFYENAAIAMWIGFMLSAFSVVANDSIQTIGTFISSNGHRPWWILWLFIGTLFLITISTGWLMNAGDVSFGRLMNKGFAEEPTSFHFLQIAAPIILLILTRARMPVSTTFLLLSSFSTSSYAIAGVLEKSITGYLIAFVFSFILWWSLTNHMNNLTKNKKPKIIWQVLQWITSGTLWVLWIIQDAANIGVFLPRQLNVFEFLFFAFFVFFGLGVIFYLKGDKIQKIVDEKSSTKDVRSATVIDLVYAVILVYFTWVNPVPMSTTWVFIGLLAGRELGIKVSTNNKLSKTFVMIGKDLALVVIGLLISIAVAIAANPIIRRELAKLIGIG